MSGGRGRGDAGRSIRRSAFRLVVKWMNLVSLTVAATILMFSPSDPGERESDQ